MNQLKITWGIVLLLSMASHASLRDSLWSVQIKYLGLTYHPGGGYPYDDYDYPRALDSKGYFVLQKGLEMDLDWQPHRTTHKWLGYRWIMASFKDCIDGWSGHVHLAPRFQHRFDNGIGVNIGIGPTWIWRENWWIKFNSIRVNGQPLRARYKGDFNYGSTPTTAAYETAFLWYGGNVEVNAMLSPHWGIAWTLVPGLPNVLTNSFGLRYQL